MDINEILNEARRTILAQALTITRLHGIHTNKLTAEENNGIVELKEISLQIYNKLEPITARYSPTKHDEYLQYLSIEYDVNIIAVRAIAGVLGINEDHSGLINALKDYKRDL